MTSIPTTLADRVESAEGASRIKLKPNPEVCPGVYDLDLYCRYENPAHSFGEFPHGIVEAQTFPEAVRLARRRGWIVHRDRTATCPKCAAALRARQDTPNA